MRTVVVTSSLQITQLVTSNDAALYRRPTGSQWRWQLVTIYTILSAEKNSALPSAVRNKSASIYLVSGRLTYLCTLRIV